MDSGGEEEHVGWYLWVGVSGMFYARRLKTSPPVTARARTEKERDDLIAAYLKHGRKALDS